jgi:hypothetical protein
MIATRDGHFDLTHGETPETVFVFERSDGPYPTYAGRYMPGYTDYSYGYYPPNLFGVRGKSAGEGRVFISNRLKIPLMPEGESGESGLVSQQLIIPPVRNKSYDSYGTLFNELWRKAEDAFTRATEIVLIGYSFPETDTATRVLLKKAFTRRSTMPRVVILDPRPDRAAWVLKSELGITDCHLKIEQDYFGIHTDLDKLLA